MNRRDAVLALLALGTPLRLMAQPAAAGVPRVGLLISGSAEASGHLARAFIMGMTDLGYQDGKNVRYEFRHGDGSDEKLRRNAAELVAAKVDLIWAPANAAIAAAQKATLSLPIIFAIVSDPVASGFVRSLPRPGTNATGITSMTAETGAKRIQLLDEIVPNLRRIGVLQNPVDSASGPQLSSVQQGARALGKELMVVEARAPEEFSDAFAKLAAWHANALVILDCSLYFFHRKTLSSLAAKHRWPTLTNAEAGGVIAYGVDYSDNCRRSAVYVDKILKGAKPADLPVQQPTKFEYVLNLKAAKAMGLVIPKAVLLRADRVIE